MSVGVIVRHRKIANLKLKVQGYTWMMGVDISFWHKLAVREEGKGRPVILPQGKVPNARFS